MFWYPVEDQKLDNEGAVRYVAIALDEWFNYTQNKEVSLCCPKGNPEDKSCLKNSWVQGKIKLDFGLYGAKCKSPKMPAQY